MKYLLLVVALAFGAATAQGTSTINPANAYSYGANTGWMRWRTSGADGVEIGEYICAGYIHGANVGWIYLGTGLPTNGIQYSNASATDFGINYSVDASLPGYAFLRGYGYGANIGWVLFESTGNPRLRFSDGRLEGYVWSPNCGWINLGNGAFTLTTDSIAPGRDNDNDGMADAFEFQFFSGLGMNGAADTDGDGMSNLDEYLQGSDPFNSSDRLRITVFAVSPDATSSSITWTSTAARVYHLEVNPDLNPANWSIEPALGIITPDPGSTTTRAVTAPVSARRFYRVRALRPLQP